MKRTISTIALITALIMLFTACGNTTETSNAESGSETVTKSYESTSLSPSDADESTAESTASNAGKTLVVVFSATGTTKAVAERIVKLTGADFYEIKAAQEYSSADLNWNDSDSRTTKEQNDKSARPAIGSSDISLEGYDTVFIGYPIWWGEEPRILDTFVEKYDFTGITCVPFCTSGGSGVGRSDKNLENNSGSGNWVNGKLLNRVSNDELSAWISEVQ